MSLKKIAASRIGKGGSFLNVSHEAIDDLVIEATKCEKCQFRYLGLKGVHFVGGSLKFCHFRHCYLRYANFERVDLTGTEFVRCNLSHAKFAGSKLWYVGFRDCELDYDAIVAALPTAELYLRRLALRSLRMNAQSMGESRMANRLLLLEMEAARKDQFNIIVAADAYYQESYFPRDRVWALVRWCGHWLERLLWGYGVRIRSLIASATAVIFVAALLFWMTKTPFYYPERPAPAQVRALSAFESVYVSAITFSTLGYGDFTPATKFGRTTATVLSLIGAVYLGLVAATAYKRIQR